MKIAGIIAVLAVLIIGGYYLLNNGDDLALVSPSPTPSSATLPVQSASPSASPAASSASNAKTVTITYTDSGFSPSPITINQRDTVIFKNSSTREMWPASAQHPTHGLYPEAGGCIGSKFDACTRIAPGGQYSFTFNQKGSWNYHDHLTPTFFGRIVVN